MTYPKVLVRSEQSRGRISVIESVMPPGVTGPSLHKHDFDEAFYVIEGELTFHLGGELRTVGAGELAFAPGGEPQHVYQPRHCSGALPHRLHAGGVRASSHAGPRAGTASTWPAGAAGDPTGHPPRPADRGLMRSPRIAW